MKMLKYALVALTALSAVACSKWTDEEKLSFDNQQDLKRAIPLIEMTSADQLTPEQQAYYAQLRAWKQTPHVRSFGWFGGWTAKGSDPQKYLRMLPDSVDIISLWGTHGSLTEDQKTDLKFFQEVKGGKVLLCWIIQNLGEQLTPADYRPDLGNWQTRAAHYWQHVDENGTFTANRTFEDAIKLYANAICDTIDKYNLDGFDIDYEPGYGHSGNMATSYDFIGKTGNVNMYTFIKTLYDRLNPKGKIITMDGEPYMLNKETSQMITWYIYQAYDESTTAQAIQKMENGGGYGFSDDDMIEDWEGKSFLTMEFQKYAKTGGYPRYTSSTPEIQKLDAGRQIMDYATMIMPNNGKRIAGFGLYHIELDTEGGNYRFLRQAIAAANRVSATQTAAFQ